MGKNLLRTLVIFGIVLSAFVGRAQTPPEQTAGQFSFLVYQCAFDKPSNSVQINSIVLQNGAPDTQAAFAISRAEDNAPVPDDAMTSVPLQGHSPIKLTLVLDLTDTFPLTQVKTVLSAGLNSLSTADEVGIIGFGSDLPTATPQYYTDHGLFSNDVLFNMEVQKGQNNRLYDALYQAVSGLDPASDKRQVILVMTDSKRKATDAQRTAQEIISLAQSSKAQIFVIGLNTAKDEPDPEELGQITRETKGYAWLYLGNDVATDTLQHEFEIRWNQFTTALNSEFQSTISATALQPDANTQQVTLNMAAALPDRSTATDRISCPIQVLTHTIALSNLPTGELLSAPRDVQVVVDPPLDPTQMSVEFWLNDQIVQKDKLLTYHLDPSLLTSATNTLQVQLRDDLSQTSLASTQLVTITAQRALQLKATNDNGEQQGGLSGKVHFQVNAPPDLKGKNVHFVWRAVNTTTEFAIGTTYPTVGDDGSASLPIDNIQTEYTRFFPTKGTEVEALAYIEGEPGQRIAVSQPTRITLGLPPAPSLSLPLVAGGASLVLLIVNLILLSQVRRQRTRRLMEYSDSYPLPDMPMYVTLVHDGDRQTIGLTNKTTQIGRGASNDINLSEDKDISRQHGAILWRKRRWYYANRKSQAHSSVNGKRIRGQKLVHLSDLAQIEIGDYVLIFHANELDRDAAELIKTNF